MGSEIEEVVGVALYLKIKTPRSADPGLPYIVGLVVLFGS